MANRFFSPNEQFADGTGLPYAGGSLTFYASGTSTPLSTFSDRALTIPNTNPVVLDANGNANNIFLQNLAYKVVLADANSVIKWTADPVYSSDFSTTASFLSGAGSPNGNTAGSAGSATIPASVYWDTINNILYVCTTTGTTTTAVWTAVNASTAASVVPAPQGYLTLTSGVPVIPGDVLSATTVFYTPYVGNLVSLYNGTSFNPTVFTEISLALVASHAASNIYDIFIFNNSGVPTLVTGPSWSAGTGGSITAGSCARGTGAGGTSLSRVNGILTNAVQMSARNGSTTYTVNANLGTYLGSIFMDSSNGFVSCTRTYGTQRKWGIWNAYNRVPIITKCGDGTASWVYTSATVRAADGSSANNTTIFSGLAEELYQINNMSSWAIGGAVGGVTLAGAAGIGFNSITSYSGFRSTFSTAVQSSVSNFSASSFGAFTAPPSLGINVVTMLENSQASASTTFSGGEANHLMTCAWRG